MLKQLHISNYALIDELSVSFETGFNVITGETGAGKSILLGALGFALGDRADTNVLYDKDKKCVVEAQFALDDETLKPLFEANDLDFDSFSPNGGDPFFAIAETIANAAPQEVGGENGWSSTGRQNRHAIISDVNNATYQPLRQFIYDYHRNGLDVMAEKPEQGREAILGALANLQAIYDRNPMCYFLQLIIESKRDEIIQVFSQGEMKIRTEAANIMKAVDPSQSSRYDEMLQNKGF